MQRDRAQRRDLWNRFSSHLCDFADASSRAAALDLCQAALSSPPQGRRRHHRNDDAHRSSDEAPPVLVLLDVEEDDPQLFT
mmetsp:Transcript_20584/g.63648  ORF Transcript_20584/g.63648 Transcript_20584/m.63648 type:complete len:81 (+) Transcript_20584:241-483(+)